MSEATSKSKDLSNKQPEEVDIYSDILTDQDAQITKVIPYRNIYPKLQPVFLSIGWVGLKSKT